MESSFRSGKWSRAGFTLPEVLVAVAMVGVLSAVVLPNVVGQMSKGEVSRVVQDIQNVQQGAQMFRAAVGSWPADLADLVTKPASGDLTLEGGSSTYGTGVDQWDGPYLARGAVPVGGLTTSLDATISGLQSQRWDADDTGSAEFVAIVVGGMSAEDAERIDLAVDGGSSASTDVNDPAAGNIRYVTSTTTLLYLTSPLK